ncbi:MAG: tRNA (adenosine(37)-N6)-dimethylallyltransferase MiaA [Salinivirgaceae bacterium]|jgi:tRNA dimethylallyltransferase|nr:tRNA (adenosine(37)-N6)-dimethylallyltransferase MiaA [Bacteroidales bacterium]
MSNNLLITITGPTAIGKTDIAVEIAQQLDTEIISCDSRQVYKEMRIGTAVPEQSQLEQVKHNFIQYTSVQNPLNANDFGIAANRKLSELFKVNRTVVMVGGSGLYIDAVLGGIDDIPSPKKEIREELQRKIDNGELFQLQKELQEADPQFYSTIDINNPRRILRGLEVYKTTGKPLSSFVGKQEGRLYKSAIIVLEMERDTLYDRVNRRVDIMIEHGLVDEAKKLIPYKSLSSLQTVGYQELFEHFDGSVSLEKAIEKIKSNTRQYVRKQENWFRRYDGAFRICAEQKVSICKLVGELTANL